VYFSFIATSQLISMWFQEPVPMEGTWHASNARLSVSLVTESHGAQTDCRNDEGCGTSTAPDQLNVERMRNGQPMRIRSDLANRMMPE
jgi:hypothetical protein